MKPVAAGASTLVDPAGFPADQAGTPYLAPQVLIDVDHSMSVMCDESFGPVVGIMNVVDDEEAVRTAAGRMLKGSGCEVVIARDGQEALRLFGAVPERYALVLLDLTMPGMGGAECFGELRKIRPDVRVLISSGYDSEQLTERFVSPGPTGFIRKPYQAQALAQAVRAALRAAG